jgi:hypothetical protein
MSTITRSLAAAAISVAIVSSGPVKAGQDVTEIPPCNVSDNRSGQSNQCSPEDEQIGAIILKVATEEEAKDQMPAMGFFVCTCGKANLHVVKQPEPIQGTYDPARQMGVFITSINPLCPVWVGGMQILVTCTTPPPS